MGDGSSIYFCCTVGDSLSSPGRASGARTPSSPTASTHSTVHPSVKSVFAFDREGGAPVAALRPCARPSNPPPPALPALAALQKCARPSHPPTQGETTAQEGAADFRQDSMGWKEKGAAWGIGQGK